MPDFKTPDSYDVKTLLTDDERQVREVIANR